jgi:hypothetical protein
MAAVGIGDVVVMVLGAVMVVFGVRGPPGYRRVMTRPNVLGTWRHGALVALALIYSIFVPTLGVVIFVEGLAP